MEPTVVNRKELIRELEWVNRFSERKSAIPILANVLLENAKGDIKLTGTDLEISGVGQIKVHQAGDEFRIAVPVKKLVNYLKLVEDAEVRLSAESKHWLTVAHGPEAEGIRISGLSHESYPVLPAPADISGKITGLGIAIDRTVIAASFEESRFTLNGLLLDIGEEGNGVLVATDGHRLATADVQSTLPKGKVLIPTRALREVSRLLSADDEVSVSADENHVAFHLERRVILARKLTGNFPDYHRVLPDNKSLRYIDVDVASWKKAIKRVSVFSDERSKCVRFNIEHGVLNIHAKVSEDGEATNSLKLASNGFSYESGFNAKFLLEGLDELAKDASVRFAICRGEKAGEQMAQFVTDHYRYAVMPMRI